MGLARYRLRLCWLMCLVVNPPVSAQLPSIQVLAARLKTPSPLTAAEVTQTIETTRRALGGHPFRVRIGAIDTPNAFLFETDGHLRVMQRTNANGFVTVTEYTGQPARACDGSPYPGELIIDYDNTPSGWKAGARPPLPVELYDAPAVQILLSDSTLLSDSGLSSDGARGLSGPWKPASFRVEEQRTSASGSSSFAFGVQAMNPDITGTQALFVDTNTLRPVRYELSIATPESARAAARARGQTIPETITVPQTFQFDDSIDLRRPEGVRAPNCI